MNMSNLPVTLEELKQHLRITGSEMDRNLQMMLLAAINAIENFTLIAFEEDYKEADEVPFALKAAILLTAGRLIENPTDTVDSLPTASKSLAQSFKRWDRIKK